MKYVTVPDCQNRPLPFYLAMEEYLAKTMTDDELWFMWIVSPTVIIGRNQDIDTEVNLDYCRDRGIAVVRRKSGGGCVYADCNNVMFSYICRSNNVATTFSRYTSRIVDMLSGLGLDASATGRNDILVNGLKVSGSAFYHLPGRSIVHGTMLYDTNFENMSNAINPPVEKLRVYGVQSVPQRITTLRPLLSYTLDEFTDYARRRMSTGEYPLTESDVINIEALAESYYDERWLRGRKSLPGGMHRKCRIEGVGMIDVRAAIKAGKIYDLHLYGDFFPLGDIVVLYERLEGVDYDSDAVDKALSDFDLSALIAGLDNKMFINLIFNT